MASTGRPLVSFLGARAAPALAPGEWAGLYLAPDRAELGQRIDARFDAMLAQGALDEVAALMQRRLDPALPVMRAHGVPHLIAHLEGRMTLDEAAKRSKLDTRHYAKRQFTWARHQLTRFQMGRAGGGGRGGRAGVRMRARLLLGEAAFLGDVFALPAAAGEAGLPVLAAFCEASGRTSPRSWRKSLGSVLSRSVQLFASAGALSARTVPQAVAERRAHKRKFSQLCSHIRHRSANAKRVSAYLQSEKLET